MILAGHELFTISVSYFFVLRKLQNGFRGFRRLTLAGLEALLQQSMLVPIFCGDLVCGFRRIVGGPNFNDQFEKIVKRYMGVGCGLDVVQRSACLVLGRLRFCGSGFLFGCVGVGRASGSVSALAWVFDRCVGAWCLSVTGPTAAQLVVFFSSDYRCHEPFVLFHHGVLI